MADSTVGDLDQAATTLSDLDGAETINDGDLFLVEQNGQGKHLSGAQMRSFVERHILSYDGEIVASDDDAGGVIYNSTTQNLTLKIPHGAGIAEVKLDHSEVDENNRVIDYYALKTQDVYVTDEIIEGEELPTKIKVTNGKDGQGTVNSVMGIGPGGSPPNPFIASQDVPKSVLMDYIHPVGSIYMTQLPISPASIFGGTWVLIHDKFLLAAGSDKAVDVTGGSTTKTISRENLPPQNLRIGQCAHTTASNPNVDISSDNYENVDTFGVYEMKPGTSTAWVVPALNKKSGTGSYSLPDYDVITEKLGSGTAMDVMPPYRTVYVWLRTSPTYTDYTKETIEGKYVSNGAAVGTVIDIFNYKVATSAVYNTMLIACSKGDKFTISGSAATSATGAHVWGFVSEAGKVLQRSTVATVSEGTVITAPDETGFLIVNWKAEEAFSIVGGTVSE